MTPVRSTTGGALRGEAMVERTGVVKQSFAARAGRTGMEPALDRPSRGGRWSFCANGPSVSTSSLRPWDATDTIDCLAEEVRTWSNTNICASQLLSCREDGSS